jgi:DNA-binding transcriptional LysR family regulator
VGDAAFALQAAILGQGLFLACTRAASTPLSAGQLTAPVPRAIGTGRRLWLIWPAGASRRPDVYRFADWLLKSLEIIPPVLGDRSINRGPTRQRDAQTTLAQV